MSNIGSSGPRIRRSHSSHPATLTVLAKRLASVSPHSGSARSCTFSRRRVPYTSRYPASPNRRAKERSPEDEEATAGPSKRGHSPDGSEGLSPDDEAFEDSPANAPPRLKYRKVPSRVHSAPNNLETPVPSATKGVSPQPVGRTHPTSRSAQPSRASTPQPAQDSQGDTAERAASTARPVRPLRALMANYLPPSSEPEDGGSGSDSSNSLPSLPWSPTPMSRYSAFPTLQDIPTSTSIFASGVGGRNRRHGSSSPDSEAL